MFFTYIANSFYLVVVVFELVELEVVEFGLVVVGGIGASRNAIVLCTGKDIVPITRPIATIVTVEMATIINVALYFICI